MTTRNTMLAAAAFLATVSLTALTQTATASSEPSVSASRSRVEARCYGAYTAVVRGYSNGSKALFVYDGGDLIASEWVDKRVIETGAIKRVEYKTDAGIFDGGLSLRSRVRDHVISSNAGSANLTMAPYGRASNSLLDCSL